MVVVELEFVAQWRFESRHCNHFPNGPFSASFSLFSSFQFRFNTVDGK